MPLTDYSYLGSGQMYARERGAAAGLIELGNLSAINFAVEEDEKKLTDYTTTGGGTRNTVKRVTSVTVSLTAHDMNGANLARFGYGTASTIAAGTVAAETSVGYKDAFLPFDFLPNDVVAPVITAGAAAVARANTAVYALGALVIPATANGFYYKATTAGTSGATIPTYPTTVGGTVVDGTVTWTCMGKVALVVGTDYEVRPGGVFLLPGAAMTDGEAITRAYTKAGATKVEMLTASGKEYEFVFVGLNEARSGKKVKITAHRVKPGFMQQLAAIGEDFGAMEVSGELLSDATKTGAGVSKYFKVDIED
jgi:hypothetical protein